MAQVRALLSNFTGGELSPRVHGRVDIKKYAAGCHELINGIVVPHGGVRKRPGSRFVIPQLNNTDTVRLVEFQYSTEQAYVLVFGPNYCWFIKDRAIITHAGKNNQAAALAVNTRGIGGNLVNRRRVTAFPRLAVIHD